MTAVTDQADRQVPVRPSVRTVAVVLLLIHIALLVKLAGQYSPTGDERCHFAAGVATWYEGRFDVYPMNPPLAHMVALLPVLLTERGMPYSLRRGLGPNHLEQLILQSQFGDHERFRRHLFLARCGVIPLSVLGACICFCWARDLLGPAAGLAALSLWCFCPETLGHGAIVACDVPGAAIGTLFVYRLWRWLHAPTWFQAYVTGVAFGLALLTKLTWLIGFAFGPFLIGVLLLRGRRAGVCWKVWQLLFQYVLAISIVNAGYLFQGTGMLLGDYEFVSVALSGDLENRLLARQPNVANALHRDNRFRQSAWRYLPVPWPHDFVIGCDRQKLDFESGRLWSYLRGRWSDAGWWYWYLYAFSVKVPLGGWALFLAATAMFILQRDPRFALEDAICLALPAVSIVAVASSQSGFTDHFRYVLPALPPIFVWCAQPFTSGFLVGPGTRVIGSVALLGAIASSLAAYPHSLAYFNELAGGPSQGHRHLVGANLDWGQDNFLVQEWVDRHPEWQPIHVSQIERLWSLGLGRGCDASVAQRTNIADNRGNQDEHWPQPGWHVIDVNSLHERGGAFEWALKRTPVDHIGYTQIVHFLTIDEAHQMQQRTQKAGSEKETSR